MVRIAAAGWLAAALIQGESSFDKLMKQALAARESNRLEESIRLYERLVKQRPQTAEAWWYLGLNYYDLDRYPECERAFAELVKHDKTNGPAWALRALCEFQNGKFEDAFQHIVRGKALGIPQRTEIERVAHYHYLQLANKTGRFELGASLLTDVARSQPDLPALVEMAGLNALRIPLLPPEIPAETREPVLLAGRAAVLAWQRRAPEAKKQARQLLEKYPQLPNVRYLMGYLALLENEEESIEWFQKEIQISPDHVQARLQIAYEYLKRGEAGKGLPYAEQAARLAPQDFTAHNIRGRLLLDLGRLDESIAALETAVKLMPASPETHYSLASAYARAGRKLEAARHREIFTELEKARKQ
jgi:tetratricopeptide (TPR) repeat protein